MKNYETMFIINPELEDEATESIISRVEEIISDQGGTVAEIDQWGTRELAYEIDDYGAGYYVVVNFQSSPEVVNQIEKLYRVNDDVLRFIILKDE